MNAITNRKSDILARVYVGRALVKTSGCKCAENKEVRNLLVRLDFPHIAGMHLGKELDNNTVPNWTLHLKEEDDGLFPLLRIVASRLPDEVDTSVLNGQINQLIREHNNIIRPLLKQGKVPPDSLVREHGELEDKILRKYKNDIIIVAKELGVIDKPKIGVSGILDETTDSHEGSGVKLVLGALGTGVLLFTGIPVAFAAVPFVLGAGSTVVDAVSSNSQGTVDNSKTSEQLFQENLGIASSDVSKGQENYNKQQSDFSKGINYAFSAFGVPGVGAAASSLFDSFTKDGGPKSWDSPEQKNRAREEFKKLYAIGFVRPYYSDLDAGAEGWADGIVADKNTFLSMPENDKKTWLNFINWAYTNGVFGPPFRFTYSGLTTVDLDKLASAWSKYTKVPINKISNKLHELHTNMMGSDYYRLQENRGKALSVYIQNLRGLT